LAWTDLLSADEQVAGRALLVFATHSSDAVPFLKEKLKPLKLTKERAAKLITDLASVDEKVATAAFAEMRYFDPRLAVGSVNDLRATLLDNPDSARRLGSLLCDMEMDAMSANQFHWYSPDNKVLRFNCGEKISNIDTSITVDNIGSETIMSLGKSSRKATWTRAIRAIVVLEHNGSAEALKFLEELAGGHADAAPTKAAKVACDRLKAQLK
jgi:hypothetical protein